MSEPKAKGVIDTLLAAMGTPARADCQPGKVYSMYDPPLPEPAWVGWLERFA